MAEEQVVTTETWKPMYITEEAIARPGETMTAELFNKYINLLITATNNNTKCLDGGQTEVLNVTLVLEQLLDEIKATLAGVDTGNSSSELLESLRIMIDKEYASKQYVETQVSLTAGSFTSEIIESVKTEVVTSIMGIYTLTLQSSVGNTYSDDTEAITLRAILRRSNSDVTDTVDPQVYSWTRISSDADADFAWNAQSIRQGSTLTLSKSDLVESCSFRCAVTIPQDVLLTDHDGNYILDHAGNYITGVTAMDALTADIAVVESLKGYKSKIVQLSDKILLHVTSDGRLAYINLENGSVSTITLKADDIKLEGIITANGSFRIDEDGTYSATAGSVGGWDITPESITKNGVTLNSAKGEITTSEIDDSRLYRTTIAKGIYSGVSAALDDSNMVVYKVDYLGIDHSYENFVDDRGVYTHSSAILGFTEYSSRVGDMTREFTRCGYDGVLSQDNTTGSAAVTRPAQVGIIAANGDFTGVRDNGNLEAKRAYLYNLPTTTSAANIRRMDATSGEIRVSSSSSLRYKDNITTELTDEYNPDKLYDVDVVQFKYKKGYLAKDDAKVNKSLVGFIVENMVDKGLASIVDKNENGEYEMWNDHLIIPMMMKLIQNQHKEDIVLKKELEQERIARKELEKRLSKIERMMNNG